jgi:hypothetical protein
MALSSLQEISSVLRNDASGILRRYLLIRRYIPIRSQLINQQCAVDDTKPTTYIPDLSDYDRVEMILRDLKHKNR